MFESNVVNDQSVITEFTREEKESKLFFISEKIAYHPISICAGMVSFILAICMIAVVTGMTRISETTSYDWIIADTIESRNTDALSDAIKNKDVVASIAGERRQTADYSMIFVFTSKNGDIYQPDNLQDMCRVESAIAEDANYKDFCVYDHNNQCIMPTPSIVVFFYGFTSLSQWNCTRLDDSIVNAKKAFLYEAAKTLEGQVTFGVWLDKGTLERGYSMKARSSWLMGTPLKGYNSSNDRAEEQNSKYESFLTTSGITYIGGIEGSLLDFFGIDSGGSSGLLPYYPSPLRSKAEINNLDVLWFSWAMSDAEFSRIIQSDIYFTIFSILFVLLWMTVHTRSVFIGLMGMFMIFTSIPFAIFIYKGFYRISFFSELHSLAIFIVLGVGADDVFVLSDSWKMTALTYPGSLRLPNGDLNRKLIHRRLYDCYKHTLATVFNTSLTTAVAFLATGLSPLMPISSFGWFASTCIVVNFIFVITLMPSVVLMSELYFSQNCFFCIKAAPINPKRISYEMECSTEEAGLSTINNGVEKGDNMSMKDIVVTSDSAASSALKAEGGFVEIYIKTMEMGCYLPQGWYIPAIPQNKVCTEILVTPASGSDKSEKNAEGKIEIFHANIISNDAANVAHKFGSYGDPPGINSKGQNIPLFALVVVISLLIFGIFGASYGAALTPPTEQENWFPPDHMYQRIGTAIANDFFGFDEGAYETAALTFGIKTVDRSNYNIYVPDQNRGAAIFDPEFKLAQPSCQKVVVRMCEDLSTYECSEKGCSPTFKLVKTDSLECFMTSFREWSTTNFNKDTYDMGEAEFYTQLSVFSNEMDYKNMIGFIDRDLKYASIKFQMTMKTQETMMKKQSVRDVINHFMKGVKNYDECNECHCESLMFTASYAFTWLRSEEGIVYGFYQGMIVAFPIAFLVLLFATDNYLISLYAIGTVFFIVFGVLGFVNYSMGWELGVAESIAGIIIIGFSVDYTVHLGHMFNHADEVEGVRSRKKKFEFASRLMVATIVGGAITTAGAGVFMFGCQLVFFTKMAMLIVTTILLSYLYALGFFMAVLFLFGPERDQGKVGPVVIYMVAKCKQAWAWVKNDSLVEG
jgi:hypothetical protein